MSAVDAAARAWIERALRDGEPLVADYPTVFGERAAGRVVFLEEERELRAACTLLARELVIDGTRVRAGLIGSVVTDPAKRGRGWGTKLLREAERVLRGDGCMLALLWADDRGFYARRGWREIGCERDFVLSRDLAQSLPTATHARELRPDDAAAIHALYARHRCRVERAPAETAALLAVPGMQVLVHARGSAIDGYACLGRGRDLAGVVHEWGGATEAVLALVRAFLERGSGDDGLFLMSPGPHGDLAGRLALAGAPSAVGVLGMGKLLDVNACGRLVGELTGGATRSRDSSRVELSGPHGAATLGAEELLELAFAPRGERGAARDLGKTLGLDTSRLPLAPFVWGLDSI